MARVRYTGGGRYVIRDGPTFTDEQPVASVSPGTAERLTERPDFETVADETDPEAAEEKKPDDEDVGQEDGPPDRFDPEQWLGQNYTVREQAVLDGDVDEHLGKILQIETSKTVKDAVDERRADGEMSRDTEG